MDKKVCTKNTTIRGVTPTGINKNSHNPAMLNHTVTSRYRKTPLGMKDSQVNFSTMNATVVPKIKRNLIMTEPAVDWELECAMTYDEYLIATFENQEMEKLISIKSQDCRDQLQIHRDVLHNAKEKTTKSETELQNLEALKLANEKLDKLQAICDKYLKLCNDYDFNRTLVDLVNTLEPIANRVYVANIKPIDQVSFDRLIEMLRRVLDVSGRIAAREDIEIVNKLANSVNVLEANKDNLCNHILSFNVLKKTSTFKLMKNISDHFARQCGYNEIKK